MRGGRIDKLVQELLDETCDLAGRPRKTLVPGTVVNVDFSFYSDQSLTMVFDADWHSTDIEGTARKVPSSSAGGRPFPSGAGCGLLLGEGAAPGRADRPEE